MVLELPTSRCTTTGVSYQLVNTKLQCQGRRDILQLTTNKASWVSMAAFNKVPISNSQTDITTTPHAI